MLKVLQEETEITEDGGRLVPSRSFAPCEFEAAVQHLLDLGGSGLRMAAADAFAGDLAGHFVEVECDGEPLFAGHLAVTLDLLLQGVRGGHDGEGRGRNLKREA